MNRVGAASAATASACLLALALAGCASPAPSGSGEEPRKLPSLAAYAANPFVPVNLYLNANVHASGQQAALVEHIAQRLRDSNAFVRVDRGVQRWPITLQATYRVDAVGSGADRARRVGGWLTLGLLPVRVGKVHTLVVEVFEEPESLATLELALTARDRVSLYDLADPDRDERAAAETLLERMLAELAARKLVPRWSEFKPGQPQKKKPKPQGRAT
jgi:hypothetical protein